jgi:fused signal recognition particle receptor
MLSFFKGAKKVDQGLEKAKGGWFRRLLGVFDRSQVDESLWEELEEVLLTADAGVETTAMLLQRVRDRVKQQPSLDPHGVRDVFKEEMLHILAVDSPRTREPFPEVKPLVVLMVGVNGSGKTTSIAKLAHLFQLQGKAVVLAAGDTFRAGAIEQLRAWGRRLDTAVIAHQVGGDPSAVAFDAMQAAKNRGADVVLIDTAGRLHTKSNLMEEMKKIRRVIGKVDPSAPHATLLVLDATTGQNGLAQARAFKEAVSLDGLFLSKLDGTAKGGIVLAICHQLKLPIWFVGTGEQMEDIAPFDASQFVDALFSAEG